VSRNRATPFRVRRSDARLDGLPRHSACSLPWFIKQRGRTRLRRLNLGVNQSLKRHLILIAQGGIPRQGVSPQTHKFTQSPTLLGSEERVGAHASGDHDRIGLFCVQLRRQCVKGLAGRPSLGLTSPSDSSIGQVLRISRIATTATFVMQSVLVLIALSPR
jgi:hypothetical protein